MVRLCGAILAGALAICAPLWAESEQGQVDKRAPAKAEVGTPTTESIGVDAKSATGKLAHTDIVPGSEWVYIGLTRARRDLDYTIDNKTGLIAFKTPLVDKTSIRVDYSYYPSMNASGAAMGLWGDGPVLMLRPGYASKPLDGLLGKQGINQLTYGLESTVKLGTQSALSGTWYLTAPQDSRTTESRSGLRAIESVPVKDIKSDRLVVQNADLGLGSLRVKMGYQSVGTDFKGFDQMRQLRAGEAASVGVLEKEKGIKRIDMAADLAVNPASDMSVSVSRVLDKKGEVSSRIFGLAGNGFVVNYGMREVSKGFVRFNDLREADRGQIAAEAGLRRSLLAVRFAGLGGQWSAFSLSQLAGAGGGVTTSSVDLALGGIRLRADNRSVGTGFGRMSALDSQERGAMALAVRRQFDPSAKAESVTDADRNGFSNEAGLDRANYSAEWAGAGIGAWVSAMRVGDAGGGVGRTALRVQGTNFGVQWSRQSIDDGFGRLASLQPVERASFGNETGMTRSSLAGNYKFGKSEVRMQSSEVADDSARYIRQSIDFVAPGLSFHTGVRDISDAFTRVADLADQDRNSLLSDRGFKRSDMRLSYRPGNWLAVDSFIDNAANSTDGRTRSQGRHEISYTPDKGPKVKVLSSTQHSVLADGSMVGESQQQVILNHTLNIAGGTKLTVSSDSRSTLDASTGTSASRTLKIHMESDQRAANSFVADTNDGHYDNGQWESVRSVGLKSRLTPNLSVYGLMEVLGSEGRGESGTYGSFGLNWAINKDLKLALNLENVGRGENKGRKTRQFSLNGLLANRFLFLDNVRVGTGVNTSALNGQETGCDNAIRLEAGFMGGKVEFSNGDKLESGARMHSTSRGFSYKTDQRPERAFHASYSSWDTLSGSGDRVLRNEFSADAKLWANGKITITGYNGLKGPNGREFEQSGSVISLSHTAGNAMKVSLDYAGTVDGCSRKRGRSFGLGVSGVLPSKAEYELQFGRALSDDGGRQDEGNVFRMRYDHKISEDSYISFSARKRVGGNVGTATDEGDVSARIDLQMAF